MPAVIPLVVSWATSTVLGQVFVMALKMAVAYAISRALAPKPGKLGSMSNPIQMTREAAAARRVIYGQTRASGPIIFAHVTGEKNSDLHLVIALAGHKLAEIGQILINDEIVEFDVDGESATGKYAGKLRVRKWLGDQTTADSVLVTESGGVWTSAHVCQGIACIYAKLVFDQDVFPQGIPNISAIVKGREVYDPRDESTAWSDNPALCALDYMRDTDVGFAATDGEIDYASHAAAASVCDEAVALAAGGTEKRYRCAGVFATDGEPASIIEQLVGTMSGTMVYSGGKFSLKAGAYEIPTVEFNESHLRGPIQFQTDSSRRDVCNVVKGTYTSIDDLYQPRDFPQWRDDDAVTSDAEEITRDLALDWVHSPSQAQRLAAIEERASRLGGTIILQCNLSGLRVQVGDTITVKNARFGWTAGEVFKVIQFRFSAGDGAVGVDLTCRRTASSVYAWTAASEEVTVAPGAEPETGGGAYTIPGGDAEEPGTYDDLIAEAVEAAGGSTTFTPSASVEFSTQLLNPMLVGYPEYTDLSSPTRYYLRRTLVGSSAYTETSTGRHITVEVSGSDTYNANTGALSYGVVKESYDSYFPPATYAYSPSQILPESVGIGFPWSLDGGTVFTKTTRTYWQDGDSGIVGSADAVETLDMEDTEEACVARTIAANPWPADNWAVASNIIAIYQRVTSDRGTDLGRFKFRVTATGCGAFSAVRVTTTIQQRVSNSGGEWVDVATSQQAAIANASGVATFPASEIIAAPRGYERRLSLSAPTVTKL